MPWQTIWDEQLPTGTTIGQADENQRRIEQRVEAQEFTGQELIDLIGSVIRRDVGEEEHAECPNFVYTLSRLKRRC